MFDISSIKTEKQSKSNYGKIKLTHLGSPLCHPFQGRLLTSESRSWRSGLPGDVHPVEIGDDHAMFDEYISDIDDSQCCLCNSARTNVLSLEVFMDASNKSRLRANTIMMAGVLSLIGLFCWGNFSPALADPIFRVTNVGKVPARVFLSLVSGQGRCRLGCLAPSYRKCVIKPGQTLRFMVKTGCGNRLWKSKYQLKLIYFFNNGIYKCSYARPGFDESIKFDPEKKCQAED